MSTIASRLRSAVLVFLTHQMALPLLKIIRNEERFPLSMDELEDLPAGTLGNDLANFLQIRNLELLPYYARHDMKHILLEYDTTDEGEGCLQFFMLGNGHISFPVMATVLYCLLTMPGHWSTFRKAYTRGKQSVAIADWDWFSMVTQETQVLKIKSGNWPDDHQT